MKVLIDDGLSICAGTGIGRYVQGLWAGAKEVPGLDLQLQSANWLEGVPGKPIRRLVYSMQLETLFQRQIKRAGCRLVHFANYYIPVRRPKQVCYAVTIHDLTPWYFPETLPPLYCRYLRWAVSRALHNTELIFTVSDYMKQQISTIFNLSHSKVYVTHNGVDPIFFQKNCAADDAVILPKLRLWPGARIILFVGTLEKRKNIEVLVKAFENLIRLIPDVMLVLTGKPGYGADELVRQIRLSSASGRIVLWGYATERELLTLYQRASLFVYPSKYEGFGIPILEAMAAGVPVIVSDIPPHREVVGRNGLYFLPHSYEDAAVQMARVLKDQALAAALTDLGQLRAAHFTWKQVAERHLAGYQAVLEG